MLAWSCWRRQTRTPSPPDEEDGDGRRERHRQDDAEAAGERAHDLERHQLAIEGEHRGLGHQNQQDEHGEAGADICEEERVHGRSDMRTPDARGRRPALAPTCGGVGGELPDGRGLGDGHVVEDAGRADDDGREEDGPGRPVGWHRVGRRRADRARRGAHDAGRTGRLAVAAIMAQDPGANGSRT